MNSKLTVKEMIKFELRSFIFRLLRLDRPKLYPGSNFLHLGCASNYIDGMVNADFFGAFRFWLNNRKIDWQLDLRYPLNCDDSVFDGVFTEHTLEHLYIDEAEALLNELHRVMKDRAIIRITVPDLKKHVDFYTKNLPAADFEVFASKFPTGAYAIRRLTQQYLHRSVWDFEELKYYMEKAGFVKIERKAFGECGNPKLCLDLETRSWETLYVEAQK